MVSFTSYAVTLLGLSAGVDAFSPKKSADFGVSSLKMVRILNALEGHHHRGRLWCHLEDGGVGVQQRHEPLYTSLRAGGATMGIHEPLFAQYAAAVSSSAPVFVLEPFEMSRIKMSVSHTSRHFISPFHTHLLGRHDGPRCRLDSIHQDGRSR